MTDLFRRAVSLVLAATLVTACQPDRPTEQEQEAPGASLVVRDARIWTGNPETPWVEAIASDGERIVAVGSNSEIESFIGDGTEVIAVPGSMLVPGMIDTHVHFITGGSGLASVQLRDAATREEFVKRIG